MLDAGIFPSTSTSLVNGIPVGDKAKNSAFMAKLFEKLAGVNGISIQPSSSFYVQPKTGLTFTVNAGWGIMSGYPFALPEDQDVTLTSSTSEQVLYVGVRLDVANGCYVDNDVKAFTTFVSGTDRAFAKITLPANAVTLTVGMIEDLRYQAAYCGTTDEYRVSLQEIYETYRDALVTVNAGGIPGHKETHYAGAADAIPYQQLLASGKSVQFDATLLASGWGADCANLFDETWTQGSLNTSTGAEESSANFVRSTNYIAVSAGTAYSIAHDGTAVDVKIFWYTASAFISYSSLTNGGTANAPATATRCRLRFYRSTGLLPADIRWSMFNSGATIKEWEPKGKGIHLKVASYAALAGMTNVSAVEVISPLSKNITAAEIAALQAANIFDGTQVSGSEIVLHARRTVPTINLPVRVIVRGDLY